MDVAKRLLLLLLAPWLAVWAWYANRFIRRLEDIDLDTADVPGSFIDIDGHRVHYVEAGQGDPVVLIHGWNASTFSMRYVIPELARRYRVIAIDLLGYGYSARAKDGDYSIEGFGNLVVAVMDRLGIERATALGHSMGGGIAMWLATHRPERVDRVILVDTTTNKELLRGRNIGLIWRYIFPLFAPFFLNRRTVRRGLRMAVHDPAAVTEEMVEGHFRPFRVKGHQRVQQKQLVDRRRDKPLEPAKIGQPTLILWGEHDRWIRFRAGDELARQIPHARIVPVYGAGHLPLEEQPEFCNRELLTFLAATVPVSEVPAPSPALEPATN